MQKMRQKENVSRIIEQKVEDRARTQSICNRGLDACQSADGFCLKGQGKCTHRVDGATIIKYSRSPSSFYSDSLGKYII